MNILKTEDITRADGVIRKIAQIRTNTSSQIFWTVLDNKMATPPFFINKFDAERYALTNGETK